MHICVLKQIYKIVVGAALPGKGVTQSRCPSSHKVVSALVEAVKPKYLRPSHKTKNVYCFLPETSLYFIILGGKQASDHSLVFLFD